MSISLKVLAKTLVDKFKLQDFIDDLTTISTELDTKPKGANAYISNVPAIDTSTKTGVYTFDTIPGDWTFGAGQVPAIVADADTAGGTTNAMILGVPADKLTLTGDFTLVTTEPKYINIRYHVESENNYDWFKVFLNGAEVYKVSGIKAWEEINIPITSGTNTISLRYSKDVSDLSGYDNVRIGSIGLYNTFPATITYNRGDFVLHNNITYIARTQNPFTLPPNSSVDWGTIIAGIEGTDTLASGKFSHAEGQSSVATGAYSHAEGSGTESIGSNSHVEGTSSKSLSVGSHAEGHYTIATLLPYTKYTITATNGVDYTVTEPITDIVVGDKVLLITMSSGSKLTTVTAINGQVITTTSSYPTAITLSKPGTGGLGEHSEGYNTTAGSNSAHAEGNNTFASAASSHAEGSNTKASGEASHSEGTTTTASGTYSHAEGINTLASGNSAHAEGTTTQATGNFSHAEGGATKAQGTESHAEGYTTTASADYSHAEGAWTNAQNTYAHAEGNTTTASGSGSHAEGSSTTASGLSSHAEGNSSIANVSYAHAEGNGTTASGISSHAEGDGTIANGGSSHAEGNGSKAYGAYSHVEGYYNTSSSQSSHAEGNQTLAVGGTPYAINAVSGQTITLDTAPGWVVNDIIYIGYTGTSPQRVTVSAITTNVVTVSGATPSTSWTYAVKPNTDSAHAEGYNSIAMGSNSHTEGSNTKALGSCAHAEGNNAIAKAFCAHSEGYYTLADSGYCHAEGAYTLASSGSIYAITAFDNTARTISLDTNSGLAVGDKLSLKVINNGNVVNAVITAINALVITLDTKATLTANFNYAIKIGSTYTSHTEGEDSVSVGRASHAGGFYTIAKGMAQTVIGKFNVAQGTYSSASGTDKLFIVGNGTADNARSNAFDVDCNGDVKARKFNGQSLKNNSSTATQTPVAATRTYIAGTNLQFPAGGLAIGTRFKWMFDLTKTASGTAASTIDICLGTAGTTADTARLSFTKPAGTAVADCGRVEIDMVLKAVGASTILVGHLTMSHNLNTTGLLSTPSIDITSQSSTFDGTTATNIGLCITSGASEGITIAISTAEAFNV